MAAILVSFLNYFVFFGPATYAKLRDRTAADIRKRNFENKASPEETLHRCVVCKRTEKDNPSLNFAFPATARNIVSITCQSEGHSVLISLQATIQEPKKR